MNLPPYGSEYKKALASFAVLKPAPQDNPNMTIKVSPGGSWFFTSSGATYAEFAGGNSTTITAPSGNPKWVIIALTSSGTLATLEGSEAATPALPAIPARRIPLAAIYLQTTSTKITDDMLFDMRYLFAAFPYFHADLQGVTASGAHPIAAITDLQTTLDALATSASVTSALAAKADNTGATGETFNLNSDATGTPAANVVLGIERGDSTNVGIRWNENIDTWEATQNGTDWYQIALNSNEFAPKTFAQSTQPTLAADGNIGIWKDTDDTNKIYIVYRRGAADYVKIELT